MAANKCKSGRKLILEMDKVRGRCYECVKEEVREPTKPRKDGGRRGKGFKQRPRNEIDFRFADFACSTLWRGYIDPGSESIAEGTG